MPNKNNENSKISNSNLESPQSELEKLIAEESEAKERENKVLKKDQNKVKTKKTIAYSGLAALAIAVIGGVIIYDPFTGSLRFGDGQDTVAVTPNENDPAGTELSPINQKEWFQEDSNLYPISLESWQTQPYANQDKNTVYENIKNREMSSSLGSSSNILPQEATGFTSDVTQQTLEDGTINPLFSYWTAENFTQEVGTMLERLSNPVFGGWDTAQYSSSDFQTETLQDLFTDRWLGAEGLDPKNYPVYVDWTDENYGLGDQLLTGGTRWAPEIQSVTNSFNFDSETQQYKVQSIVNIKYTAWKQDQTKIEKNGVLTLDLVANPEQSKGASENRVLIDSAKLEVS